MSTTICPACNKPLPASVVNGPAQAVVRCDGCQTLLLWSNGRVMRSARSATSTMMGMPAVQVPTVMPTAPAKPTPAAAKPAPAAAKPAPAAAKPAPAAAKPVAAPAPRREDSPLPALTPEADAPAARATLPPPAQAATLPPPAKPAAPKTPAPPTRTATQPLARLSGGKPSVTGLTDDVPTRVATPTPRARNPTPPPMKIPPSGPVKVAATTPAHKDPTPPPARPTAAAKPAPTAAPVEEKKQGVVASVAQVPEISASGEMVDPSVWFAGGETSEVMSPEKVPALPAVPVAPIPKPRLDGGAAPLPPPPALTPLEAEPFEIEAPGEEKTPAIGTLMPEMREQLSAPIAVREAPAPIKSKEPSAPVPVKAQEPTPMPVKATEPSGPLPVKKESTGPIKTADAGKKSAASIRGAEPSVPSPTAPSTSPQPASASFGLAATMMGPAPTDLPRAATTSAPAPSVPPTALPVGSEPPPSAPAPALSSPPESVDVAFEETAEARLPATDGVLQPTLTSPSRPMPRRTLLIGGGAAASVLLMLLLVLTRSHGTRQPAPVPVSPPTAAAPAPAPAPEPTPPPTKAEPAPPAVAPPAEPPVEAKTPEPPRPRRTLGGKKVVLEYDPKPTSPAPPAPQAPTPMGEDPSTVARARESYHNGNVKLFAGDPDAAIGLYRQSIKIYPGYVAGYRGLGLAYEAAGNSDEALKAFHTYVRTVPNAADVPIIRKRIEHLEQKPGAAQ